jgi:hypothetical protein
MGQPQVGSSRPLLTLRVRHVLVVLQTCFGWFKPTYNGDQVLDEVRVTSASFRADQKNDATNVLTSGAFSLSATPDAPFLYLGNSQGNVR